ncbi:aminopeptidase P family protein [cf. Phormidesmis sp. LEGE 11477]|uniref:aminopeptidase P family protein n=1 Tax=cf. Phormidesmis sp. LEGE 11477 TaxID=1828680 RepID=UPI001880C478|nr:aminopeptidase P family protein [cf. Phormidesmis sp. LEGE 11477]MBE9060949.1 aminopeptidase P family protein [cf. Phormidesmis sp. LEGE 11477]
MQPAPNRPSLVPDQSPDQLPNQSADDFNTPSLSEVLRSRRHRLAQLIDFPVLLWSGTPKPRNFAANIYPFRASSHFLYFAGLPLQNAAILLGGDQLILFIDNSTPDDALWHGPTPNRDDIAQQIGAAQAYPLSELANIARGAATLGDRDETVKAMEQTLLQRGIVLQRQRPLGEKRLEKAIVRLRMIQDRGAIAAIRKALAVTIRAHKAGMAATPTAKTEAHVRAAMESVIIGENMSCAYGSIVTIAGEVLHNNHYHNALAPGDLLLADVGAETMDGWASDITRTWPVSGKFSSTQKDLYDVVLAAHDLCIEKATAGTEYKQVHLSACHTIAAGLVELGILQGNPADLVDQDAHALFFPHGVGHLMGLDVHDMEDLGDLSGYAERRGRSDRFGLAFLRLDRPLEAGMAVTIEPGFYQVPAILNDKKNRDRYANIVNWEKLEQFKDVRGIRIEDDVLITSTGNEVLSQDLPTSAQDIETLVQKL